MGSPHHCAMMEALNMVQTNRLVLGLRSLKTGAIGIHTNLKNNKLAIKWSQIVQRISHCDTQCQLYLK